MAEAVATVITVERITTRNSPKSGKQYWTAKSGEEYYNIWDGMLAARLQEGQTYTCMVESNQSGDKIFHNLVGLAPNESDIQGAAEFFGASETPLPVAAPVAKPVTPPAASSPQHTGHPALPQPVYITEPMVDVRKSALAAANLLLANKIITQKSMEDTLRKYENYILHGLKPELKSSSESGEVDVDEFVAND